MAVRHCVVCGRELRRRRRGMCSMHYNIAHRAGTLGDWPLEKRPKGQVTEEVMWFVEQGVPAVQWPDLLNMKIAAIERALYRAGRDDLGRKASLIRRQEAS